MERHAARWLGSHQFPFLTRYAWTCVGNIHLPGKWTWSALETCGQSALRQHRRSAQSRLRRPSDHFHGVPLQALQLFDLSTSRMHWCRAWRTRC